MGNDRVGMHHWASGRVTVWMKLGWGWVEWWGKRVGGSRLWCCKGREKMRGR